MASDIDPWSKLTGQSTPDAVGRDARRTINTLAYAINVRALSVNFSRDAPIHSLSSLLFKLSSPLVTGWYYAFCNIFAHLFGCHAHGKCRQCKRNPCASRGSVAVPRAGSKRRDCGNFPQTTTRGLQLVPHTPATGNLQHPGLRACRIPLWNGRWRLCTGKIQVCFESSSAGD